MMKSAKFTEAQRKEEKAGDFDCVGLIVSFCEKRESGGAISRYQINEPLDKIDETIKHLKDYEKTLIYNDTGLAQRIENYLKNLEANAQMKKDRQAAKEAGQDKVIIEDKDMEAFNDAIEEDIEKDMALLYGEE